MTRIVISSILIVLNLALQHNDSISWDLVTFLARSQFFMVWEYLTKDTRFGILQNFLEGETLRGIVMSFSKMGGEFKEDRNPYIRNHSIRDILVWGYEVWDRNGFLGLGMSDLCRYIRGAFTYPLV